MLRQDQTNKPEAARSLPIIGAPMEMKETMVASIAINWKALGVDPKIIVENSERIRGRFIPTVELSDEPCAVVAYGTSLRETWPTIRDMGFNKIFTCSGAHKFLIERGIVPTFHCESDPRGHKVAMLGKPHPRVTYLMASNCHSNYFDALKEANSKIQLWHVLFENSDDTNIFALYPKGDWIICGGNTIGPRTLRLARLSGYTNLHIFGLDGSGGHADVHTNPVPASDYNPMVVGGQKFMVTKQLFMQAIELFKDLDRMPEVQTTWYGDGMYQTMARNRTPKKLERWPLAIMK